MSSTRKKAESPPSIEALQHQFVGAVGVLKSITDELTTAQWLRDYEGATPPPVAEARPLSLRRTPLNPARSDEGQVWFVALVVQKDQPAIELTGDKLPPATYLLSSFMEAAAHGRDFRFGWNGRIWRLTPVTVQALARQAVSLIPRSLGEFNISWTPADPRLPF